ncbi:MAG: DNA-binding protein [Roseitalea porphyridii]|jgi:predicted DNA binding CopG/RHH family protein|uniref:DNA-binding protein n=1 Tax=Roseitalea porphyridii TaxID=1852022 RepID=UPI0032D99718
MAKEPTIGAFIDEEEREIYEALERDDGEWVSVMTPERKAELMQAAQATFDESTQITIDIRFGDLLELRARAEREGLSEQELINAILHKAVSE